MDFDFLVKLLVIGESGTGKSCLLHRYLQRSFKDNSSHTIGVEFGSKIVKIGERTVKLQIWDTAGQERFRSVTKNYYRGAAGALLVYDITDRETFHTLKQWLTDTRTLASQHIHIMLVGNKLDLAAVADKRAVTYEEANQFATENGLSFTETSAVSGEGVDEAFRKCASSILTKIELGQISPEAMSGIQYGTHSFQTEDTNTARKRSCCS